MPTIELTHATKSFQQFTALNDVSLTVEAGTILCLIGPSGAGKSTLVKCLMGMEKLTQGTSRVLETAMPNRTILKRIGYMAQEDALYEDLTGKENLYFFGQMMGLKKQALKQACDEQLALMRLTDFQHTVVKNYSGGMKRRLSLAITLLADPDLLILDEPTVGIDPRLRVEIWQKLRALADQGKSILVTTHVMDEAEKCDTLGLIIDSQLFALGTPQELKAQFQATTIEEVFLKAEVEKHAL
ncbi:ABC-2 type transport system ATP-binding protein [Enterococcus sp. DIV2402]|uniref:ABC-2 type transport system ATP-binding protein n=1 Tax=Candidatus Enterococcus lowellii TaxID=2230877 RepID=A0ABZ2SS50_9ENTE|nr:ABC transporter ATP-binding protein [Enterococcus sp. DIV2402]MBO0462926.1 ABC transporter ATP-binding protein [Enterococcus sp. DIV2402]